MKLGNTAFKFGSDIHAKNLQKFNVYGKIHRILSFGFLRMFLLLNQVKSLYFNQL